MSTERKIQGYLHLYGVDCPIMTPDGEGSVLVIYPNAVEVSLNVIAYKQEMKGRKGGGEMHYKYFYSDVKLILRNLSDMTEEEMLEFVLLRFEGRDIAERLIKRVTKRSEVQQHVNFGTGIPYAAWGHSDKIEMVGTISANELGAEGFRYLLSCGFDLFNLIPDGLAIDKTTLKP